jgi:hypothetical protein
LQQRLTLGSPALVKELYQIAQRQLEAEKGRQFRLDAKATSLLTVAGLSLTVVLTFVGPAVLKTSESFRTVHAMTTFSFAVAVFSDTVAAILAVWALRVRDYITVNEHAIFDPVLLAEADAEDDSGQPEAGVTEYRKALIIHLWIIAQTYQRTHAYRATLIRMGQTLFLFFLCALLFVCLSALATVSGRA